jgi:hypothetical protein
MVGRAGGAAVLASDVAARAVCNAQANAIWVTAIEINV